MFKIGDFSRISRVSVKTLRYYDELGLLKPESVDVFTGYRNYSASQLPRLNRILALKDLGLSLDQVGALLDGDVTTAQMRAMLGRQRLEIEKHMDEEKARLTRVEARLHQIEMEGSMSDYDIVIKSVPAIRVASVRGIVPKYSMQEMLWRELEGYLHLHATKPVGPCFSIYHDPEYKETNIDCEACEPIGTAVLPATRRVQVYELPAVARMACVVHKGPFTTIPQSVIALSQWIEASGYRICGPNREIYIYTGKSTIIRQDDPSYVTENQFPVDKVG